MANIACPTLECSYCGEEFIEGHLCNKTPKWKINKKSNNEWVEINLPWNIEYSDEYYEKRSEMQIPDYEEEIDKRSKIKFGTTYNEFARKIKNSYASDFEHAVFVTQDMYKDEDPIKIYNRIIKKFSGEINNEKFRETNDWVLLAKFRIFSIEYSAWLGMQDVHINWLKELPIKLAQLEKVEAEKNKSFVSIGLNKVGTVIEVKDYENINQYLIGDVDWSGDCGCDKFFSKNAVVLRYKIVWEKEENEKTL